MDPGAQRKSAPGKEADLVLLRIFSVFLVIMLLEGCYLAFDSSNIDKVVLMPY